MRAEWLKMSIFAPKKLCGRWTVNCSETRTTLILDRYCNELFIFAMVIGVNNLVIVLFITIKSQVDEINSTKM
jgi:hypothetical protein